MRKRACTGELRSLMALHVYEHNLEQMPEVLTDYKCAPGTGLALRCAARMQSPEVQARRSRDAHRPWRHSVHAAVPLCQPPACPRAACRQGACLAAVLWHVGGSPRGSVK